MSYKTITVKKEKNVGVITLNRPDAMNALSTELVMEIGKALDKMEDDDKIGAIILTGGDRVFAAGADIKEMQEKTFPETYLEDFITKGWEHITKIRKPIIAAVSGFALGGGCEVALMCDIIIADETAQFGQPEIKLGIIPGAGGTQRLTRVIGKYKAMEMILTGRFMGAEEAYNVGLISSIVVNKSSLLPEALKMAGKIASMSRPAVLMAKECVNAASEMPLSQGVQFERRAFQSLFGTPDQKEGMAAFVEKRKANFGRGGGR